MSDIAVEFQKILSDWNYELNGSIPSDLKPRDNRSFWWLCGGGHAYKVSVHSRLRSGGCKKCNADKIGDRVRRGLLAAGRSQSLSEAASEILLKQWNHDLNGSTTPANITYGSNKLVWWTCEEGHGNWQATPKSRMNGGRCPVCDRNTAAERKVSAVNAGIQTRIANAGGSLAEKYPGIAKEWDIEKNNKSPSEYTYASNSKVHWVCKFGHNWQATIYNRTQNGSGCPSCRPATSEIELFCLCELRSLFRSVHWRKKFEGKEIDIFIEDISVGIEIDGGYWHRDKYKKDIEKNKLFHDLGLDLYRIRHESLKEIDFSIKYDDKEDNLKVFHKLILLINEKFKLDCIYKYVESGSPRNEGQFRKMLSALPSPVDGNDLGSVFPDLSIEWDMVANSPLEPHMFGPNSDYKAWWACSFGHKWDATIKNRTARSSGCPVCNDNARSQRSLDRYIAKFGSVFEDESGIISQWDYERNVLDPKKISIRYKDPVQWLCSSSGHSFSRSPATMRKNQNCPVCGSLALKYPKLLLEYDQSHPDNPDPVTIASRSGKSVWWKCPNGHSFKMRVADRTSKNSPRGCPVCLSLGFNFPELLAEFELGNPENPDPFLVRAHSSQVATWVCSERHHYSMRIADRTRPNPSGCPDCAKSKRARLLSGFSKAKSQRKKSIQ